MKNIDKIKQMSAEEMADFLAGNSPCNICTCDMEEYSCMAIGCKDGVYNWLTKESEE